MKTRQFAGAIYTVISKILINLSRFIIFVIKIAFDQIF